MLSPLFVAVHKQRRVRYVAGALLVFVAALNGRPAIRAGAAAMTFTAVANAYTSADQPATSFGDRSYLVVGHQPSRASYLRFGVTVPAGTVVTKATMRAYAATSSGGLGVDLRGVTDNTWAEATITSSNAPPAAPTAVAHAGGWRNGSYVSFDVTSLVTGSGPLSVALTTGSSGRQTFAGRRDPAHPPLLAVETAPARATAPSPPPPSTVLFGVAARGAPWDMTEVDSFATAAGKSPGLVMWYQDFAHFPDFDPSLPDRVTSRGAQPMLTWEPWDYTGGANQPAYALARLIDGTHDAQIKRWASEIAAWNRPLLLRFAHEMNGNWNSWSEGVNGNRPGEYVTAYRHVRDIFRAAGAGNVTWVWSPNVVYSNSAPLAALYPGDAYVDRVALDGYNWGSYFSYWKAWLSFDQIFDPGIAELRALTAKPVMVAEMASTELGGDKAAWITATFAALKNHPEIIGFVWFNFNKETDWRIQSSAAATSAFAAGVADPRFAGAARSGP